MPQQVQTQVEPLHVICWSYSDRLDGWGGWGYSVHPTAAIADTWEKVPYPKAITEDMNHFAVPSPCGRGLLTQPTAELLTALGRSEGVFFVDTLFETKAKEIKRSGFKLTRGRTPRQVTEARLDEVNDIPD